MMGRQGTCWGLVFVVAACCALWVGVAGGFVAAAAEMGRPNILLLMADQMRGDCVGADGNAVIHTPNLDRLAAEGALFRCAYSSTPSCTPARAALLTGLSPWHHGMLGYGRIAQAYAHEMPRMLAEAGYETVGIGKMHFHPARCLHGYRRTILYEPASRKDPAFQSDYYGWFYSMAPSLDPEATGLGKNDYRGRVYALPEELHPTRWTGDVAVRFLEQYRGDKPFLLKVSFHRPHSPYDPPERFMKMYENADVPPAVIGDWAARNDLPADPKNYALWRGNLGPEAVRQARQAYYGSVSFVDEQVGRILAVLERRGWLDNTLILFTADHGDMLGDHHLWRKTYAYEGSARIPMIIRWPKSLKARRGQVIAQPVELRDVLPTFMDAAGVPYNPRDFDGRSMLALIRGRTDDWRPYIDLEHSRCYSDENYWTALTDGCCKYIYHPFDDREQLFDLRNDPKELHDLARDPGYAETLRLWRHRMVQHLSERGEPFVKDGRLVPHRPDVLYSPNYPRSAKTETAGAKGKGL